MASWEGGAPSDLERDDGVLVAADLASGRHRPPPSVLDEEEEHRRGPRRRPLELRRARADAPPPPRRRMNRIQLSWLVGGLFASGRGDVANARVLYPARRRRELAAALARAVARGHLARDECEVGSARGGRIAFELVVEVPPIDDVDHKDPASSPLGSN